MRRPTLLHQLPLIAREIGTIGLDAAARRARLLRRGLAARDCEIRYGITYVLDKVNDGAEVARYLYLHHAPGPLWHPRVTRAIDGVVDLTFAAWRASSDWWWRATDRYNGRPPTARPWDPDPSVLFLVEGDRAG